MEFAFFWLQVQTRIGKSSKDLSYMFFVLLECLRIDYDVDKVGWPY